MWTPKGGKRREMGLGAYPTLTLAKARTRASDCRRAIEDGRDPIAEKAKQAEPSFAACADLYIASIKSEWRNAKHECQWKQTLSASYCAPLLPKGLRHHDRGRPWRSQAGVAVKE